MQVKKLTALIFTAGVLIGSLIHTGTQYPGTSQEKLRKHPGWYQQYQRMKAGENGEIPTGLRSKWQKADQKPRAKKQSESDVQVDSVQELGPFNVGGRTRAILVDQANNDHILAGSVSGGLWQSYDRGENWEPLNDQAANLSVSAITQDHFNLNEIYYSTGEPIGNSAEVPGEGIYKSVDGGASFQPLQATLNDTFTSNWDIEASPSAEGLFYVATDQYGLYRSEDGGQTFERVFFSSRSNTSNKSYSINDIEILPDGTVLIGVMQDGIYKSTNGTDFQKINQNFPNTNFIRRVKLSYCKSQPNVLYATFVTISGSDTELVGLWKSTDTGNTWQEVGNPDDQGINFSLAWYALALKVSPTNPDVVFAGSVESGVSTDGGNTWQEAYNSHADYHTLTSFPDNPNRVLVGNDGGIYEYQWNDLTSESSTRDLNSGYHVTQFYAGHYFPKESTPIGGTQDNGSHGIANPDSGFLKFYGADGGYAAIHQQNPDTGYISTQRGRIRKSTNIRDTHPDFDAIYHGINANFHNTNDVWFINPFEMNLADGDQIYFVTKQEIWRTLDGGENWEAFTDDLQKIDNSFNTMVPYTITLTNEANPTAYIGGENKLFVRVEGAAKAEPGDETDLYESVPGMLETHFLATLEVDPSDPSILYAGFSNYDEAPRIWKVTGSNTNSPEWEAIDADLPAELPVNSIAAAQDENCTILMAGTDFGVYQTNDDGETWHKIKEIPNVSVHQVRYRASDQTMFAYTHGRGIWSATLKGAEAPKEQTPIDPQKLTLYPNPTTSSIQFSFPNGSSEEIKSLYVVNTSGQIILEESGSFMQNRSGLNLAKLTAGLYWIQIETNEDTYQRKFIKQ